MAIIRQIILTVTVAILGFLPPPAPAADLPMQAVFTGSFVINLGTLQLSFSGDGVARHLGHTTIEGQSTMVPVGPTCFDITNDFVVWTAANGDGIFNVNTGQDCLDFSQGALPVIVGSGTYSFIGGTRLFADATGDGTWRVRAPVTSQVGATASGTFELVFTGTISSVGHDQDGAVR